MKISSNRGLNDWQAKFMFSLIQKCSYKTLYNPGQDIWNKIEESIKTG